MTRIDKALASLANAVSPFDESGAKLIRKLGKYSPQQIADDLSIWGGAGSLMDYGFEREQARHIEAAAIELGHALVEAGLAASEWSNGFSCSRLGQKTVYNHPLHADG